jgi:hypothetical protein
MNYRPFRSLGRFVLAACAVGLGAANLGAQTPATPTGANPSRVDLYMGYAYFGAHGSLRPPYTNFSSINEGAIGSGAYYFNKYAGGEFIYTNSPNGANDGLQDASVGPIVRLPLENFTIFAHGLVGGVRLGGPNNDSPSYFFHNAYTWGTELTVGGGMDYDLPFFDNRFSLRLFQVDYKYIHDDFGPYSPPPPGGIGTGGRVNMDAVELSAGFVAHFGHIIPPPPVTYACVVAPPSGFPGDPITVTGTALNLNPKKTATYSWTSDTGPISSTSNIVNVDTKALSAGSYTVKGHVTEGPKPGQSADCSAQFAVKAFEPPTISCSASPTSLNPGDSATITATAVSPQNRPLSYSYSASAGSVTGTSSTATLSTAGAAPGTIAVTCNVVDDKGHAVSAQTSVTVIAPPPPPPPPVPTTSSLCSISFERDTKRPTRVDNEAKACLDDVALNLQRVADAKLALVGDTDSKETAANAKKKKPIPYGAERAVNTKDYLVTEKGIDPSRIMVYTGSTEDKSVTSTLIPVGATLNTTGDTPVDESAVKAVPRTPVKKKK